MGPAGGMFATARDLARLIQVLLDGGRLEGHKPSCLGRRWT
jgi:CubicO group peptidase (beta-lactamase class C family)